ncbi:MAG: DUF433 domain-containing protein [Calothrix sp. FI2-JRJ7]|nr:DUF433 domain-containing protein [Calothrix sp. FI2-JRJ7]
MPRTSLQQQLLALDPAGKAEAIQILTQNLSNGSRGITKTPGVCGGDARIAKTRIPVWSLINYRRLGASDATILEAFPHLTAVNLVKAWAYADAHQSEMELAIRENDEVMQ